MDVTEIVTKLEQGERVVIAASDSFEFMRECVRHHISTSGIAMKFENGHCHDAD